MSFIASKRKKVSTTKGNCINLKQLDFVGFCRFQIAGDNIVLKTKLVQAGSFCLLRLNLNFVILSTLDFFLSFDIKNITLFFVRLTKDF